MSWKPLFIFGFLINIFLSPQGGLGAELLIGTAVADITPTEPVAVSGQFNSRIARKVERVAGRRESTGQAGRPCELPVSGPGLSLQPRQSAVAKVPAVSAARRICST